MIYFCCDDLRRNAVKQHGTLNGIDFLEVLDDPALPNDQRQRTLFVHCIKPLTSTQLTKKNIQIEGGERIRNVVVEDATIGTGAQANVLSVRVKQPGDFSTYTLRLVADPEHQQPPINFDPLLSAIDFSFKVGCPNDFDCERKRICPPEAQPKPEIDYLAKDYASFRRLMLDRMSALIPEWKERGAADLGVALVELLAYVGDYLSYQQDALATEAYLGTARKRTSLRRHARLVDYFMHDGCNARAWVAIDVGSEADGKVLPGPSQAEMRPGTSLITKVNAPLGPFPANRLVEALSQGAQVFEIMHDLTLYEEHNEIQFYTWGDQRCCLPKGATRATLRGGFPNLKEGGVLIFEEVVGPQTQNPADADPAHRHAVRLTEVLVQDKDGNPLTDSLNGQPISEIKWHSEDALPFPLCLWEVEDRDEPGKKRPVSVARGNIVLADHGRTIQHDLHPVPSPDDRFIRVPAERIGPCEEEQERAKERERLQVVPRFRPRLKERPLTQAASTMKTEIVNGRMVERRLPFDPKASAAAAFRWKMKDVLPAISLDNNTWLPRRDLLASDSFAKEFVVEVEGDGTAYLRFGDGQYGMRPGAGASFHATYRVGNGVRGNVGAEAVAHIVSDVPGIVGVRNLMPAQGGVEPESIEHVRQSAPYAFRTQERAVTEGDYAKVAGGQLGVQRAAATFRWTGSWHTVFVTADRLGGTELDPAFAEGMRRYLEGYRMAAQDVEIDGARYVSMEIEMHVCVKPDYFRSQVKAALLEVFSNRMLPDGRRGVFHPDNFTFGQTVHLSPLYAAAQAVPGVASAQVTTFRRQGIPSIEALNAGKLVLGRLEIARLDNDPNFPEHGVFRVILEGGK